MLAPLQETVALAVALVFQLDVTGEGLRRAEWLNNKGAVENEIAYSPARVLMQDFTGVPAVVDLAAMRDAMVSLGG
ncbi:hypothetical protein ACC717_37870, partial [Rhizobium ruizarguesonis]